MMNSLKLGAAAALLLSGVIAGCSNNEDNGMNDPTAPAKSASESTPETTDQDNTNAQTLNGDFRQYSTDPNKDDPTSDYNVVGSYVTENADTMTLEVNGEQIVIPKSNSYQPADDLPTPDELPGQMVSLMLNAQDSTIGVAQLASNADDMDNTTQDIVGQFVSQTDTEIVIKQGTEQKTYKKAANYEGEKTAANEFTEGVSVRLDLDQEGNVIRLRGEYRDGSSVGGND